MKLTAEMIWIGIGLLGQAMFFLRFVIQWLASEKAKRSVIPDLFWYFSIAGALVLLAYALYRQDPVFILGQSMGMFIYVRNIYLIKQNEEEAAVTDPEEAGIT